MTLTLKGCPSIIFDCDGVILQSNRLKSDALGEVLVQYDPKIVAAFVAWHKKTGGVSRFEKFANFFRHQLGVEDWQALTDAACVDFGKIVFEGLCRCPFVPGFDAYLAWLQTQNIPLAVNTGGAEDEVRAVFRTRGMLGDFQTVLGSPTTKFDNMIKLREMDLLRPGAIYFGDSKLDFELARDFELHFVYVGHESEWPEGKMVTSQTGGQIISDYQSML
jgi:phosphoglycolate phosphatase-like HAD superfamily hydrolase